MRAIRWLVVVVIVLAGLLLVADRVGAWAASRVVADQVASELSGYQVESSPPDVSINGFPFLTQVAAGRYESVTLMLRDVGRDGLRLPLVELTAHGVEAPLSTIMERSGPIHADRVAGTAVIGYDSVAALTGQQGLELSSNPDGTLRVRVPAEVLGNSLVLVGDAGVETTGDGVRIRVSELAVAGSELPAGAESAVEQLAVALSVDVALPPLPYGLTVESVRAEPGGLAVSLSARDVPLSS